MIAEVLERRCDLQVPTADLPRADADERRSIDRIAVPRAWTMTAATRLVADIDGSLRCGASHDVYVVEIEP